MVVVSAILNTDHPEAGIGSGVVLFAAGAILSFAVQIDVPYIADYAMGTILMAAGAISVVATFVMLTQRRRNQQRRPLAVSGVRRSSSGATSSSAAGAANPWVGDRHRADGCGSGRPSPHPYRK